jgi:hypothetical protein
MSVVDGQLEESEQGVYNVTINTNPLLLPSISTTYISDDYFSKLWSEDKCIAGPFSEISTGHFQLNKAFICNK